MLRKLRSFSLAIAIVLLFVIQAYANPAIDVATNGGQGKFDPGSVVVISGQMTDGGVPLPNNHVLVQVKDPNQLSLFSSDATTDGQGYYRAIFTLPGSASSGTYSVTASAGQASVSTSFSVPANNTKPLTYNGWGYNTSGSPSGQAGVVPTGTNQLVLVFSSNVNYFFNKKSGSYSVGINESNQDCITLLKGSTAIAADIVLVSNDSQGSANFSYYSESNQPQTEVRKRIIIVKPAQQLEPNTDYTILISKDLSANNGDTLGADQRVTFKTAAEEGPVPLNIATLYSDTYTVSTGGTANETITNVPSSTSKATFLAALKKVDDNQTWDTGGIHDPVASGDKLVVTAQDGTTKVTYTVTVNTVTTSITGGGGGGGGPAPVTTKGPAFTGGTGSVNPAVGATVGLGNNVLVVIPEKALNGIASVTVTVQEVSSPPAVPASFKIAGKVYEFTVGGQSSYTFGANVGITLSFDPSAIGASEVPAVFYYDQSQQQWVNLGGAVTGSTITVQVNHFTKYAVFAIKQVANVQAQPGTLNDIAGHWAEANIRKLVDLNVISGYPDGSFKPDDNITRAEFATLLVKAFKLAPQNGKVFLDTAGHWAENNISTAALSGIVNGYEDGSFGPDDLITREQMAVMIVKAKKMALKSGEIQFADGPDVSAWARDALATAIKYSIMKGYPDNTFLPQGNATRAEAVTVIVNALK